VYRVCVCVCLHVACVCLCVWCMCTHLCGLEGGGLCTVGSGRAGLLSLTVSVLFTPGRASIETLRSEDFTLAYNKKYLKLATWSFPGQTVDGLQEALVHGVQNPSHSHISSLTYLCGRCWPDMAAQSQGVTPNLTAAKPPSTYHSRCWPEISVTGLVQPP
jgi:hypothetical protein